MAAVTLIGINQTNHSVSELFQATDKLLVHDKKRDPSKTGNLYVHLYL